jgi:hypothetical protein
MGDSITQNIGFTSASGLVPSSVGFTSASALAGQPVSVTRHGSSSPSHMNKVEDCAHTEAEFDSFGSMLNDSSHQPFSMFTSLGKQKKLFQPSAAAMKIAQERAKHWAAEDDALCREPQDDTPEKTPDVALFPRQALQAVGNVSARETSTGPATSGSANPSDISSHHANVAYNVVDVPSLGQGGNGGTFRSAAHFSTPSAPGSRSLQAPSTSGTALNAFTKPFKSPLLNPPATRNSESSQYTPSLFNSVAFTPTKGPKAMALDPLSLAQVLGSLLPCPSKARQNVREEVYYPLQAPNVTGWAAMGSDSSTLSLASRTDCIVTVIALHYEYSMRATWYYTSLLRPNT